MKRLICTMVIVLLFAAVGVATAVPPKVREGDVTCKVPYRVVFDSQGNTQTALGPGDCLKKIRKQIAPKAPVTPRPNTDPTA